MLFFLDLDSIDVLHRIYCPVDCYRVLRSDSRFQSRVKSAVADDYKILATKPSTLGLAERHQHG